MVDGDNRMHGQDNAPDSGRTVRSRIAKNYSRRRVVAGAGAFAFGSVALVGVGAKPTAAEVSVESLNVKDASFEGSSVDPVVDVEVAYEFDVPGASQVYLALEVGGTVISDMDVSTRSEQLEQTTDLSGRVAKSQQWEVANFSPPSGESVSHEIAVALKLVVTTDDGQEVTATAEDTATIEVTNPSVGVAQIGGVGTITRDN